MKRIFIEYNQVSLTPYSHILREEKTSQQNENENLLIVDDRVYYAKRTPQ